MSDQTSEPTTPDTEPAPAPQGDPAADEQPLGEGGVKALKAERAQREAVEKELKALKAAQMSELERAQAEAAEARDQLARLTTQNLRNSVALAKGVPADLVEFLTGDTEDEIAAKADVLLSRITPAGPATPKPDATQGAKGAKPASNGERFAALFEGALNS